MTGRRRRGRRGRGFPSGRAPPAPSRPRGSIATPRAASRGPPRPRRGPSSPDKIYPSEKRGVPALGPRPRPFFPPRQTVSRAHRGRAAPALLPLPLGGPARPPFPPGGGEREGGGGGGGEGGRPRSGAPKPLRRIEAPKRGPGLRPSSGAKLGASLPQNPCGPRRAQERRGDDRAAGKGRGEGPWPAGHARAGRPSSAVAACGRPGRPFSPGAKYLPRGANSDGACAGPPPRDP